MVNKACHLIRNILKETTVTAFNEFHLANKATIVSDTVPGIESQKLLKKQALIEGSIISYPKMFPVAIKKAKGAIIEDVDGNQFIDFFAGCGVVNVGHANHEILEYVAKQQQELIHALDFPTQNKLDLIESILELTAPGKADQWKMAFCGPSGSDAVEAAIKLAKHHTGRSSIIAFHGSYHGLTAGSLAATSDKKFRKDLNTALPEVHFVPYSYPYRSPFKENTSGFDAADYLEYLLENPQTGMTTPAAILLEPIQGEGGNIVPEEGFLDKVVRIARKHGVLVIYDEIQSGFFRSGQFLACQHSKEQPDIITMSKGLGGVGLPISAIVYQKRIESWGSGFHVGTFRANQLSIAASRGALVFVEKYHVLDHVNHISEYLFKRLYALKARFNEIGDVRGRGLFIGIEFVKDRETKEPYPEFVRIVKEKAFQAGLLFEVGGHYQHVIRFVPPLIVNESIVENALEIFERALTDTRLETKVYQLALNAVL